MEAPPMSPKQPLFLTVLNSEIEKNLSDNNLSIQKMTRLVGMSRTDLHRKLHKAVGMSATKYIRFIRLQRASTLLLENQEWSVSYISLEVGFNNQSYFTTKFKELFGVCPCAFREQRL